MEAKKTVLTLSLIIIFTSICATAMAATPTQINNAITTGVAWLVTQQNSSTGYWQDAGSQAGPTGLALIKLEERAFELGYTPFDPCYPYKQNVEKGLTYLFSQMSIISISTQLYGNPDTDGDGIGVCMSSGSTYETGIVMMAIAASRTPNREVNSPGSPVNGWTYKKVLQEMVDYMAFGQCDSGSGRGGWRYSPNSGADNSCSGYAVSGLGYAESCIYGFKCFIPQFVKDELKIWIDYIQTDGNSGDGGGSGYTGPGSSNILRTGNLVFQMTFAGIAPADPNFQRALAYIGRNWPPSDCQAMYTTTNGLGYANINTIVVNGSSRDWYADFADALVNTQQSTGYWSGSPYGGNVLGTEWALLTLEKPSSYLLREVTLTKTDDVNDGDCVGPGREITYTIDCYSNCSDINDVNIIDNLPSEVDFNSASNAGVYDSGSRTVTWNIGTLHPGDSCSVTLKVNVKPCVEPGITITNECEIKSGEQVLVNAHENTPVCSWYPTLTKVDNISGGCVIPDNNITYTICYAAHGYGDTSVVITDFLPSEVDFNDVSVGGVYNPNLRTVTWNIGTLEPNASGCVTLTVKVNTKAEPFGIITNLCEMAGDCIHDIMACENTHVCPACFDPNFIIVRKNGTGDYTTIQAALNSVHGSCKVIEVQDSGVYQENLVFPADANFLTLWAGTCGSYRPTITLSGTDSNTLKYISMRAVGTTIQGFNINFSGSASATDGNSAIIFSSGGASTVRDCNITGPASFYYIRGIVGVATIDGVQLSNCRDGILCDANQTRTGFQYSISGSHIYNCERRGIIFQDCNAVMDNCRVELCGTSTGIDMPGGNVLLADSVGTIGKGTLNLLITNSTIQKAIWGRNVNMESKGKATVTNCKIMNALGTMTHSDEILQYCGTLNLNRCIIKAGQRACVNMAASGPLSGGTCHIDHCDFYDPNMKVTGNDQWTITTSDASAVVTIKNSIFTGDYTFYGDLGTITIDWSDVLVRKWTKEHMLFSLDGQGTGVAGSHNIFVDPCYVQTNDPNDRCFFALQPYSLVAHADEFGGPMGSRGVVAGCEKWPCDFDSVHGVDFRDFAVLALQWRKDNTIPPIPQSPLVLDTFESYTATGASGVVGTLLGPRTAGKPDAWRVVPANWQVLDPDYYNVGWRRGSSTLTLLTTDANSGTKSMKWDYDVNVPPNDINAVRYTEILVMLPAAVNLTLYDELRVSLKRLAGNSPDTMTFLYAKFIDLSQCEDPAIPDPYGIVGQVIGGQTATPVGVYYDWTINFDNYVPGVYGWPVGSRTNVGAIIFGVRTQPVKPYGLGKGTFYVDDIRLVDRPGCTPLVGDLNGDCRVNFQDLACFVVHWLEGIAP